MGLILRFREHPTPLHVADNCLPAAVDVNVFDRDFGSCRISLLWFPEPNASCSMYRMHPGGIRRAWRVQLET